MTKSSAESPDGRPKEGLTHLEKTTLFRESSNGPQQNGTQTDEAVSAHRHLSEHVNILKHGSMERDLDNGD